MRKTIPPETAAANEPSEAYIPSLHDGLDGPEQEAVPLSTPGIEELLRQDWAQRQALYGVSFEQASDGHTEPGHQISLTTTDSRP